MSRRPSDLIGAVDTGQAGAGIHYYHIGQHGRRTGPNEIRLEGPGGECPEIQHDIYGRTVS